MNAVGERQGAAPFGGEMAGRVAALDWSVTPLGPREAWSPALTLAVEMILASGFSMALRWGPDLVLIYNDAYAPILRDRHPGALGRPFREVWPELGEELIPRQEAIVEGRSSGFYSEDLVVQLVRDGEPQEAHFRVSYGPVPDATCASGIGGVQISAVETTEQVRMHRELQASEERYELALAAAGGVGTWDWDVVADRIHADEAFARLYSVDPERAGAGAPIAEFTASVHPEDAEALSRAIDEALATGEVFSLEYRLVQPDGPQKWVYARGRALRIEGVAVRFPGVVVDITARKRAEEHLQLLVNELNHRVKNSLATVQNLAAQSFRGAPTLQAADEAFTSRLLALSRAHDLLTAQNWEAASLLETVQAAAGLHGAERFDIAGPDLRLTPKAILALSMALHELAVNAVKYGALSQPGGRVAIAWEAQDGVLELSWAEQGGPPVSPPARRGFGSRLLERGLAGELGGSVTLAFDPAGVVCRIAAPLDQLR